MDIYIYIEREVDVHTYIYIYSCNIHTYTHITYISRKNNGTTFLPAETLECALVFTGTNHFGELGSSVKPGTRTDGTARGP